MKFIHVAALMLVLACDTSRADEAPDLMCTEDADCADDSQCEPTGYCSSPDAACVSGRRYVTGPDQGACAPDLEGTDDSD